MNNFKIGDVVERGRHQHDDFLHKVGPEPHVVTAVSPKGHWLCINNWTDRGGDKYPWSRANFTLIEEQDDPLPPAPESVRYYHRGYHGIHADAYLDVHSGHFASEPRIRINDKDSRGITIDADTAMQLAHDLRRMAMEIKRKEKANG